jgi:hypothetical protein
MRLRRQPAGLELPVIHRPHPPLGGGGGLGGNLGERDLEPRVGKRDGDARAHRAAADHAGAAQRPGLRVRRRAGRQALGVEQMAQRTRLRPLAQLDADRRLPRQPLGERQVEREGDRLGGLHRRHRPAGAPLHLRHRRIERGAVEGRRGALAGARVQPRISQAARAGDGGVAQVGRHLVHQPERHRLGRRHLPAGGGELERDERAGDARHPLRAAGAGNEADLHLRQADEPVRGDDAGVAAERDLETAAERGAVDGGDDRLRAVLDRQHKVGQARRRGRGVELADVGAGHEGAPLGGDHRGADGGVGPDLRQRLGEAATDGVGKRVDRRVLNQEQRDVPRPFDPYRCRGHRRLPFLTVEG